VPKICRSKPDEIDNMNIEKIDNAKLEQCLKNYSEQALNGIIKVETKNL
jgi:hypothetical protein